MDKTLEFKCTTSRGRDTYGYNIVSLYVDGSKETSCNGGGYDMQGTALGDYIAREYQTRLLAIKEQAHRAYYYDADKNFITEHNDGGLYGMQYDKDKKRVSLDGACGFRSIEIIAEKIGLHLTYLRTKGNASTLYTLMDEDDDYQRIG